MSKLIPGVYSSVKDAQEQRLRQNMRLADMSLPPECCDCRNYLNYIARVAKGFRDYDSNHSKLAELFSKSK